jgi:hypothetical protein
VSWAHRADHSAGFFVWPRTLLDLLEAGEPVTVQDWQLGSRRVPVPASLRPGSTAGKWWRITPNDVVERASSPVVDRPRGTAAPRLYEEDRDDGNV